MKRSELLKRIYLNQLKCTIKTFNDYSISKLIVNDLTTWKVDCEYVNGLFEKYFNKLNKIDNLTILGISNRKTHIEIVYLDFDNYVIWCQNFKISETNYHQYAHDVMQSERTKKLEHLKFFQNIH